MFSFNFEKNLNKKISPNEEIYFIKFFDYCLFDYYWFVLYVPL